MTSNSNSLSEDDETTIQIENTPLDQKRESVTNSIDTSQTADPTYVIVCREELDKCTNLARMLTEDQARMASARHAVIVWRTSILTGILIGLISTLAGTGTNSLAKFVGVSMIVLTVGQILFFGIFLILYCHHPSSPYTISGRQFVEESLVVAFGLVAVILIPSMALFFIVSGVYLYS